MSTPSSTGDFANVSARKWHQSDFFASQTAYVAIALVLIMAIMSVASDKFFTGGNLSNIAKNASFVAIVTLGVTLVIITGGIDLSVGSTMALSAIVCAITMRWLAETGITHIPALGTTPWLITALSILAALLVAGLIGLINGTLVAVVGLSPFVTTLGMLSVVRGLAYAITEGRGQAPKGPDVSRFYSLTDGSVAGIPITAVHAACSSQPWSFFFP